ncbi:MAG: CopD family protein [Deltaproteobacteria bacterium]|nr:CopD family protein [Deltaproteobacteria bacterium]
MDPLFLTLKSIHIMGVISWMAGLLYLFRLYVNHALETEPVVMERFVGMERRLWKAITVPAAWISGLTGAGMILMEPCHFLAQGWLSVKLLLVGGLLFSHFLAGHYRKKFLTPPMGRSHVFFRVWNEVPTLLMILIVLLVEFQPAWWVWADCAQ